jgi:hypothetical protein
MFGIAKRDKGIIRNPTVQKSLPQHNHRHRKLNHHQSLVGLSIIGV